jgi:DNA-binding NarL/FixJ family response regulator
MPQNVVDVSRPPPAPAAVRRVLVVDDSPAFRGLLGWFLRSLPGFEVVGEACDGLEAVDGVRTHRPEIVLMDVRMPNMDGLEATRRLRAAGESARIILMSIDAAGVPGTLVSEVGADGILDKAHVGERLVTMLNACVCEGKGGGAAS